MRIMGNSDQVLTDEEDNRDIDGLGPHEVASAAVGF